MDLQTISRILFGKPIANQDAPHQTIGKAVGLAVFASDALSSVAYATQEILLVLAIAGTGAFHLSLPIAATIIGLLLILTVSYRQTIYAYPNGGGAYVVARENLGERAAQIAGAALLMDYILTVAVSISSGIDQVVSVLPQYQTHQVELSIAVLIFMMIMNLRGVKESGSFFALPTYFFVVMSAFTVVLGIFRYSTGNLPEVDGVEHIARVGVPLSFFLILRAFSSGCTALTGVEAISNGITAFREPKSHNAAVTMSFMSGILGFLFLGITFLAVKIHAVPSDSETVISEIGRTIFGRGVLYKALMASTTVILIMAANTSFADFPRLCALHAGDGFLPRQLTYRSGRLVFSGGIMVLGVAAGLLMIIFHANTSALIPLYAIGVFMSFTLSQAGMVVRWQRIGTHLKQFGSSLEEGMAAARGWRWKQVVNFLGSLASFIVMIVFTVTKFMYGAWVTVVIIPLMVLLFYRIHSHYKRVQKFLFLPKEKIEVPAASEMKTIILVDALHTGTLKMIQFAKTLGHPWTAIHVDYDEDKGKELQLKWEYQIGEGDLVLIKSPYRLLFEPVIQFVISERNKLPPNGIIHIITGQLVVPGYMGQFLHSKNARGMSEELKKIERVIVTGVPYQLER